MSPTRNLKSEPYPDLDDADITAALEYAARQMDHPMPRVV